MAGVMGSGGWGIGGWMDSVNREPLWLFGWLFGGGERRVKEQMKKDQQPNIGVKRRRGVSD